MDDLHFDSVKEAAKCAKDLRLWGAYMDANADKQCIGWMYDTEDRVCALGALGRSLGYMGHDEGGGLYDARYKPIVPEPALRSVAAIVKRQTGVTCPSNRIHLLNDDFGVTFPQFATACRTLAAMIEERFVLPSPAPATVDAFVTAEAN